MSDEEKTFLELQQRYHELLDIPSKDRNDDEVNEYKKLKPKYSRQKKKFNHLVEERPTATGAERKRNLGRICLKLSKKENSLLTGRD